MTTLEKQLLVQRKQIPQNEKEATPVDNAGSAEACQHIASRGNTLWNGVFRFAAQFVAICINLYLTPYIIRHLGVESYGIVGVINTMICYIAIVTMSLTATVGRNLTFAIEKEAFAEANKEISTAVFGLLRVFLIILPLFCLVATRINYLIVIPAALQRSAQWFFIFAVLTFAVNTISGPLGAAMFVRNRLDLSSAASLARAICFVGLVVGLFAAFGANLITYGIAVLSGSLVLLFLHFRIHRFLLPGIEISKRWYDRDILKRILSLGGWMSVTQVGGLLFLQTDLLVANRVLGPVPSGRLAAIAVIPLQLRVLAGLVSGLYGPTIAALAARNDWDCFSAYLLRAIRLTTLFFALLVGVFCGSAHSVLAIWLGPQFASLTPVVLIMTFYLVISLGSSPVSIAVLASGKVKIPAVITLFMGTLNIALSIFLAGKVGLIGIAISGCITLCLLNGGFVPWYVKRTCGTSLRSYWMELAFGVAFCIVIAFISNGVDRLIIPHSIKTLLLSLTISGTAGTFLLMPLALPILRRL
jgi:membrane protein EpsK